MSISHSMTPVRASSFESVPIEVCVAPSFVAYRSRPLRVIQTACVFASGFRLATKSATFSFVSVSTTPTTLWLYSPT